MKLDNALIRLSHILPLKKRQEECSKQIKELHQRILRSFIINGRILTRDEIAQFVSDMQDAINVLRNKELVIFSEHGDPVGAYPFTMEVREHKVSVNGHQVYTMCALDALAVSPMFGMKTHVTSRCRMTGELVSIQQSGIIIENSDEANDVYVGIVWGAGDTDVCCADSLCMEMMFLSNNKIAQKWFADDPDDREIFTLQEAVEFASRFFVPLMS